MDMNIQGTIFNIQHFSLQDGPGIRSTVFFKGCPLHCRWCSNPESQLARPQLLHYAALCHHCGACVEQCPQHALLFSDQGAYLRSGTCIHCGSCITACPYGANSLSGKTVTAQEVCDELHEDWRIYMDSGGGITCSGGEPLAQPGFLRTILRQMHDNLGFDTCIETSGYAPWETLSSMLPHLSRIFFDIKQMDTKKHREATGQGNELILENAGKLGASGIPITVRLPLIPGFNDTADNLETMGAFMMQAGLSEVEIMPQHAFGKSKYEALGRIYDIDEITPPATELAANCLGKYVENVYIHDSH